jgi:rare lipoprotein A
MKSLLNKKACKEFALECAKCRFHKFTRVSERFLVSVESIVKATIRFKVENHPSVGKTLMGLILCLGLYSCQPAFAETASWYSSQDACGSKTNNLKGCPTASGRSLYALEREKVLFAASNDFKLGTKVRVTNQRNGKSVIVRIFDRGGFSKYGRKIDLGKFAFSRIADTKQGLISVAIEKI